MARPIYKLWQARYTEAWYRLSPEEQQQLTAQAVAAAKQAGGRSVVLCDSAWSNEQWGSFGVVEFPDAAAAQQHADLLNALHCFRYIESRTILGVAVDELP
jgi:hypothetical protein